MAYFGSDYQVLLSIHLLSHKLNEFYILLLTIQELDMSQKKRY
ncbi:MAG: hypothetical protein ACI90V_010487, partial [Bacillariaceae sp.]